MTKSCDSTTRISKDVLTNIIYFKRKIYPEPVVSIVFTILLYQTSMHGVRKLP